PGRGQGGSGAARSPPWSPRRWASSTAETPRALGVSRTAGRAGPAARWPAPAALLFVVPLLVGALTPGAARASGDKGHVIIAHLASRLLTPAARRQVEEILGPGESLESVSVWADVVRGSRDNPGERPETARWHYVNIPLGRSFDAARDCPDASTPSCVVDAVAAFESAQARDDRGSSAA